MTLFLLDANALIASVVVEHEHHLRATEWLASVDRFAVCPVVEGALVRFLLRLGEVPPTAHAVLRAVREHPRCDFWPDAMSYADVDLGDVHGHRQVTDTYLAAQAAAHGGRLATFDRALVDRRPDDCLLIP